MKPFIFMVWCNGEKNWMGTSLVKFLGPLNFTRKSYRRKRQRGNSYEWKERAKAEGGEKETLITETLTHKAKEADTSGNQRNVSQLGDTSIHPTLSAAFLLKAMGELDRGGGW